MGTKKWQSLIKEQQGDVKVGAIPPLLREDGSVAHTAQDKAYLLAKHFAGKLCIPDPEKVPPIIPEIISDKLRIVKTSEAEVKDLSKVDEKKKKKKPWGLITSVPVCFVSVRAPELSRPISTLLSHCLQTST